EIEWPVAVDAVPKEVHMKVWLIFLAASAVICLTLFAQAPASQTPSAPAPRAPGAVPAGFEGSAYRKAAEIPPRIMSFRAEPSSIKPGGSAVLNWLTENPSSVTIEPGIGRMLAKGTLKITPDRTTTYTLTVRGANNTVLTSTATVEVAGTTPLAASAP